jgi:hypothetical protein
MDRDNLDRSRSVRRLVLGEGKNADNAEQAVT